MYLVLGGVPGPRGCLLLRGVSAPRGVCSSGDACKNITFATLVADGNNFGGHC